MGFGKRARHEDDRHGIRMNAAPQGVTGEHGNGVAQDSTLD
jgi:hypothetical protein